MSSSSSLPLFPRFSDLPPEIRQEIWRTALSDCWSSTKLRRHNPLIKPVGKVHLQVGQSCREARAVKHTMYTDMPALGCWIDFGRHVFFFRDVKFDRSIMLTADERCQLLSRVHYLVLNPRDWAHLWDSVNLLKTRCTALRALVIVGPWFQPADMPASMDPMDYAPYEDWGQLFKDTPAEMDLSRLLYDIHRDAAANGARNAEYRARVDDAVRQVPDDVPRHEHAFGRVQLALQRLEQAVQEFPGTKPNVHLRTKEELVQSPLQP